MENLRRDSSKSGKKDVEKLKRFQHSLNCFLRYVRNSYLRKRVLF